LKAHTKIYLKYFGFGDDSFISCEVCGSRAQDIHHIIARGMGGGRGKDEIQNLMALCREHHVEYGDKKEHIDFLMLKHAERL